MKLDKKFLQRIVSVLGTLCVCVCCLLVPAQAANLSIDYYVSDVYIQKGTPYVTVDFPVDNTCWQRNYNYALRNEYLNTPSISGSIFHSHLDNHTFDCFPLGYIGNYPNEEYNYIDICDFPSVFDVKFSCNLVLTWDSTLTEDITVTITAFFDQWDSDGNLIDDTYLDQTLSYTIGPLDGVSSQNFVFDFEKKNIVKDDAAVSLDFDYKISFSDIDDQVDTSSVTYVFENERCAFDFSITEEFYEDLQRAESNRLLGKIEDHLAEQNKTLDDILAGTPEQNQQAQDSVGGLKDSTDKLGVLGDTMSSVEKPVIDSSQISADSLVPETSLLVLSAPFQALWENEILLAMLTIVVTLVLVSWVFFGKKG